MTGFLGTRADVFMDLAIAFFVAAPFLMTYALRLAARGRYRAHRNLQAGLVVGGTVAVLLLEGSIQYGEAMAAYAQSAYYGTPLIRRLFSVHLWVAIPWFIGWCVLTRVSWRRYSRVLPGPFSSTHRLCGVVTYAGFWFTCITGVALYVLCYAL